MRNNIKYFVLCILATYSVWYLYDGINLDGTTIGLYILFDLPLGIIQLLLAAHLLKSVTKWQKVIPIIGLIVAALVLITPGILYLFR